MGRRPPRTSYGYLAPPGARVRGWECNHGCAISDEPAPRSWPHPCRECDRPADAAFEEPWAHEARGHWIQHQLNDPNSPLREHFQVEQQLWAYKEARFRKDGPAADTAWEACRRAVPELWRQTGGWWIGSPGMLQMVRLAAALDDIDRAGNEVMDNYPHVDTRDLEHDQMRRATAGNFVQACVAVLERASALDHPRADEIHDALRDIANRAAVVLLDHHHSGIRHVGELHALHRSQAAMAGARRSPMTAFDGLPRLGSAHADNAIEAAEIHDDLGPLDELLGWSDRAGHHDGLTHLMRARRHVVLGDLPAAMRELEFGLHATDPLARRLRPRTFATLGLLRARTDVEGLDHSIALCRSGRRAGRRWWRRTTPADTVLARLLLWRALRPGEPPARRASDVREAVRLTRRFRRPWRMHEADDLLLRQEALAARDALTGRGTAQQRHRAWRAAVAVPSDTAGKARLAVAWAEWAVGTGSTDFAAEAYQHLVALTARDAAVRSGAGAKDRVLSAAQEYAEEAGYWLARTGRYREAALALETGRAVGLTQALASVTGGDPPDAEVRYQDITAETSDGSIVYLAAAKAGGYALVVTARHDPQYISLPRLDRATVAGLIRDVLPAVGPSTGIQRMRDLLPSQPRPTDPMAGVLQTLFEDGIKNLTPGVGGRIVTLIPVGLLNLLPIHAAVRFPAVRYAPNARALGRCRDVTRELAGRDDTLLAIDVPGGHGVGPSGYLHHVARETTEITRLWTGRTAQPLHACTWEEFRAAAGRHTIWHLACHGAAEPGSILDTRLYFADRHITLGELRRVLRPGRRRLAVLSACHTNVTGSALPNEMIGLPSALIQIGFAGVIASAWAVDDLATTYLMSAFYRHWHREGAEPAVALGRAQRWLRGATRADLEALLPGVRPHGDAEHPYADSRSWTAFAYTGA